MNISDILLERWDEISEIVEAVQQLPLEEKTAFVRQACKGHKELQAAVEEVMNNAEAVGGIGFLLPANEENISDKPTRDSDLSFSHQQSTNNGRIGHRTGSRIGNYIVRELLGHGGFGEVYKAEHVVEFRQTVAIKLIQAGFDQDSEGIKRFEKERQILAELKHQNIAQLYGGGRTEDGQPYIVMEYIEGQPIDEYCDTNKLSISDRLKLFREVCAAVQYAHRNLIVHRDLKPSNIMVTAEGAVKLLDFGIAKLLRSESEVEVTEQTGANPMTLAYASPEQVQAGAITTATDVYSLGVVLYRLLTGHHPYKLNRSTLELMQAICHEEPVKPSEIINHIEMETGSDGKIHPVQTPELVSEKRNAKPEKLRKQLQGDLDNIVLMALRKEPERRYLSAEQLSEDIRGHLENLPVRARPDTLSDRTKKFVRRNKAAVLATLIVILGLGIGMGIALAQWKRAEKQADIANQQKQVAQEREKTNGQLLYATNLSLAATAFEKGDLARGNELLNKYWPRQNNSESKGFLDFTGRYLWRHNHDEKMTLGEGEDSFSSVALSPNGKTLASGGYDTGTVKLWDITLRQNIATLKGHEGNVNSVAFSPDGKTLASGSADGTVKLWDCATGKTIATLKGREEDVPSVAFSPDGKTLASASDDYTVKLWDVASRQNISTLKGHKSFVRSVAFSPDGKTLASASDDYTVKLWDVASRQNISTLKGHESVVSSVAFSPDGKMLASSGWRTVKLWDLGSRRNISTLKGHEDFVESIAFSPDGKTLASASGDGTVKLWDSEPGQNLATLKRDESSVLSVAFSPDGKTLASVGGDQTVKLWDRANGQNIATLKGHESYVFSVAFSPDSRILASASDDRTIKLWDRATGKNIATLKGHKGAVRSVAFSPDSKTLASASTDGTVKLWDRATGENLATLKGHERYVIHLFGPGAPPRSGVMESSTVNSVAFSPDGKTLASASEDGTIKLWDRATGKNIATLKGHKSDVLSVAFSPDGKTLASASEDGTIKLWDQVIGENVATLKGHEGDFHFGKVYSVVFSPDGKTLASAGEDQTVKLWDRATGQNLATLKGHEDYVTSVAFASDGKTLASASANGTVRLWFAPTDEEIAARRNK